MSFKKFYQFINETIGTVSAPVYGEAPEEYPEIAIESDTDYIKELTLLLKELYTSAMTCEYDGVKMKETLFPKYKNTKYKMNITEDGRFKFDSFGKYPDVYIHLDNMKKGKHTKESIKEEIKNQIKRIEERMPGMPSQSAIASFSSAPNLPA
jgi:hypothetical protein